jgi:molybdopterin converting factor small subunit
MITLISGPSRLEQELTGSTTVGALRDEYADILNVPDTAVATVNGNAADRNTRVRPGDEVAFTRPTGQKG